MKGENISMKQSFKHFYTEQNDDGQLKIRTTEAEEAGKKLIASRILAIGLIDKSLFNMVSFKYTYKKEGGLYDVDVTFKIGTKTATLQLDSISKDEDEDSLTFKHSLPNKIETTEVDPDIIMQLQIISKLVSDPSYRQGIKNAMISASKQIEEMKNSSKNQLIKESFESGGNVNKDDAQLYALQDIFKNKTTYAYSISDIIKYPVSEKRSSNHYEIELETEKEAKSLQSILRNNNIKSTSIRMRPMSMAGDDAEYYKYYIGVDVDSKKDNLQI